jgi:hypothetical protein
MLMNIVNIVIIMDVADDVAEIVDIDLMMTMLMTMMLSRICSYLYLTNLCAQRRICFASSPSVKTSTPLFPAVLASLRTAIECGVETFSREGKYPGSRY